MLQAVLPGLKHLILSGDTGNGFRAYAMLEELSEFLEKYGYTVELSPLAPGHAWNRTDARIAHMNTFLRLLKAKSRVFGAQGVADAFFAALDRILRNGRKYMERTYIYFRVVMVDKDKAEEKRKLIGKMMESETLDNRRMGVKGFLLFDFSVKDAAGNTVHIPGFARVREHPNPERPNNPTRVYSWRVDENRRMCQPCSDRHGGPVWLSVSNCTKTTCSVLAAEARASQAAEDSYSKTSMPLLRDKPCDNEVNQGLPQSDDERLPQHSSRLPDDAEPHRENKRKQISKPAWTMMTTDVVREVRAVHGQLEGGPPKIWLYIPKK